MYAKAKALLLGSCFLLGIGWLAASDAADFPKGPINLIIPLAPGDAADIAGRAMGEEIGRALNAPVVVVNRPGAGGAVGTLAAVQAAKDGQTILFAPNSALTFRPVVDPQNVNYDPLRDLVPLGIASHTPSVLVVSADAPYKTLAELVEYSKKNPGKVRLGHPGAGSVGDFGIQSLNALTGAGFVPVPFKGAAPGITALRGGHIEGVVLALGALSSHMKSGAFRGLVASSKAPDFPQVPTMKELGYRDNLFGIWLAFLAPAGIPDAARHALSEAVAQAAKSPEIADKLRPLGIQQDYSAPQAMAEEMREERKRVEDMARKMGLAK